MISTTRSIWSSANNRPCTTWSRSLARFSKYSERLRITSCRWAMKSANACFNGRVWGWPSTRARTMLLKEVRRDVYRNRLFRTMFPWASRRNSTTIRMPCRSDSSRISDTPSMRLSRTNWAIFSTRLALFTWKGSSVMTICSRPPRISSISVAPSIMMRPRPVV